MYLWWPRGDGNLELKAIILLTVKFWYNPGLYDVMQRVTRDFFGLDEKNSSKGKWNMMRKGIELEI